MCYDHASWIFVATSQRVELGSEPLPSRSLNRECYFRSSEAMRLNSCGLSGVAMRVFIRLARCRKITTGGLRRDTLFPKIAVSSPAGALA